MDTYTQFSIDFINSIYLARKIMYQTIYTLLMKNFENMKQQESLKHEDEETEYSIFF